MAAAQLPVVALEQDVAEKFHAYTASYGEDGRESTRVKDLVDLVLIGELSQLDAARLGQALATTFKQRARQPLPRAVPSPPPGWARPYAEMARAVGIATDINIGQAAAADLLNPVLGSQANGHWDAKARRWRHNELRN